VWECGSGLYQASKYFFFLRFESGALYRPSTRDFELLLVDVSEPERARLRSIWAYWEEHSEEAPTDTEEGPHPDALYVSEPP
jgi:hypothetical protein